MGERAPVVSPALREAFGVAGEVEALGGGEGLTWRIGGTVLKRVHDVEEAAWTQEILSRMRHTGFRVPQPVRTLDGRWTHDGWSAARYIPGLRPLAPAWRDVIAAGLCFCDAADAAMTGGADVLARRRHRWAVADRCAWDEEPVHLDPEAADVRVRLRGLLSEPLPDRQLVHGDLTGNVHLDPSGTPVVLDFSPYLRPRRWAAAIVVADAVLWHGADPGLAQALARTAGARDLLGRALIFRLVAEHLAVAPRHGARLGPYRRLLAAIE